MRTSLAETSDATPATAIATESAVADSDRVLGAPELAAVPAPAAGTKRPLDIAGISLAVLCVIHCVATPLIALLPLGSIVAGPTAEWLLPGGAILFASIIIAADYRAVHRRRVAAVLLAAAAALIAAGHAFDDTAAGTGIVVIGSAALALSLLVNLRHRRRARACHPDRRP